MDRQTGRDSSSWLLEKSQRYVTFFSNTYKSEVQLLLKEGGLRHTFTQLLAWAAEVRW